MDENKEIPNKSESIKGEILNSSVSVDSSIGNVSVRALLAILITATLCGMTLMQYKIVEPFYSVSIFSIGFFFGQKKQ